MRTFGSQSYTPGMTEPLAGTLDKPYFPAPDQIDVRFVCRVYAWLTIPVGLYIYAWPLFVEQFALEIQGMPWGKFALVRISAAAVVGAGICAAALARLTHPAEARHALTRFAVAHLAFGVMFYLQWHAILEPAIPPIVGWTPLVAGVVLLYVAQTAHAATPMRRLWTKGLLAADSEAAIEGMRSQYEEHIGQAARREERARLARDLHDAVKQQLFVIQTSAATVETRFDQDAEGAKAALQQLREAAREGLVEMQALIEELQAAPFENIGLVEALKKQCEALGFRTSAEVTLDIGELPPSKALRPGTQEALFRAAQEALANIGRHARPKHVHVTIGLTSHRLRLLVRDDGAGFDAEQTPRGMGLRNMAQRARDLGGTFTLDTRPGKGTTVELSMPYDATAASDYGYKALGWGAVAVSFTILDMDKFYSAPWRLIWPAIVGIITARYAVAYFRLRRRMKQA
jgi:signal transduction histidine kinase